MKRIMIAGLMLSLLTSSLALADPPPWAGGHDGGDHHEWRHDDHRDDRDHRDWRERQDWRERRDWREHEDWRRDQARERWRERHRGDFDDGAYRRPPGYYYRIWHRGERLPISYRASQYLIPDTAYYHLAPPPPGYCWVRVDGDAVLAAIATGVVAEVVAHEFH